MIENYRVLKEFSSGSQAETFLAEEISTAKKVVLKKVGVSKVKSWKTIELFERECDILKNLNHPAIPSYIDSFHDTENDLENLYLVQNYIDGKNLADMIKSGRRFDLQEIYEIIKQLLHIQTYLHSLNPPLVHRDIKPSNIVFTELDGLIKVYLIDFGTVNKSVVGNIGSSTIVGTIGYMAAEQFMGKASHKSDLYSTGATLLFLLTAMEPTDFPVMDMQLQFEDNTAISQLNNDDLNYFIKRLINSSESMRYANTKEVLIDLEYLINEKKIPKSLDFSKNSIVDLYKSEEISKGRESNKSSSFLYIISLLIGIVLASYIYLFNFDSFSETELIKVTPFWVLTTSFGLFGLTTKKINKLTVSLVRSTAVTALLIFFIYAIFPAL